MKRVLTAAVGAPIILAALFFLPAWAFLWLMGLIFSAAAVEFMAIARRWAPGAPLWILPPLALAGTLWIGHPGSADGFPLVEVATFTFLTTVGFGTLLLFSRTPIPEVPAALGALAFGVPYFALPAAGLAHLQRLDPWVVFLLLAIVWMGDTAAYYVGRRWGRRPFAPVVSPKKTWEGAAASLGVAVVAMLVWSYLRLGYLELALLPVGIVTAIAAQVGDLVESIFKRAAGVKDSGRLLPGHGGILDRVDALLFAAPVLWLGLLALGLERLVLVP